MSTASPLRISPPSPVRGVVVSAPAAAGWVVALALLGLSTVWSTALLLYGLWTTDALKSIGMVVPAISLLLILRAWRSLDWELNGSWWGFAILLVTSALVRLREQTVMTLVLSPQWSIFFPPHSIVALAYGAGVVILFGGKRLFRAALFPLLLLLLVNPVPHVFNVLVDLPLQRASAHVARAFAIALGQPLSPDKLRLMFTPEFGMFIAPGCNGIRGAVTMGFIALIAGYLYRFRRRALGLVVLGAVMLGYLFNLVRLCVLVLFYLVALHSIWLQDRAENADYLIGAVLFFVAVYLLYLVIQRLGSGEQDQPLLTLPRASGLPPSYWVPRGFYARFGAFALLVLLGLFTVARGMAVPVRSGAVQTDEMALGQFPQAAGKYTLARRWNETSIGGGSLLYHWAEYVPVGGGTHIEVGISPVLGAHDVLVCHSARGEDPLWSGPETFQMQGGSPVDFNAALFNDGTTQSMEASTLCTGASCGESSSARLHLGFVYSRPHPESLLGKSASQPMPILLKAETIDTTLTKDVARTQLAADLGGFMQNIDLDLLTRPYRRQ